MNAADDLTVGDERRALVRHLLVHQIVVEPSVLRALHEHRDWLRSRFERVLGYRLQIERQYARLFKSPPASDTVQRRQMRRSPTQRRSGAAGVPFGRRDYALLFLVAAEAARYQQVLLSQLSRDVAVAAAEAGIACDWNVRVDRRSFAAALGWLTEFGMVDEVDTAGDFVDDADAEALLDINVELLRTLVPYPLRDGQSASAVVDQGPGTVPARLAVRRRIAEEPVVLRDLLPDAQRAWLRDEQRRDADIEDFAGLPLEVRAEGVCAIDARRDCTDVRFPGDSRDSNTAHAAILCLDELINDCAPSDRPTPLVELPHQAVPEALRRIATRNPAASLAGRVSDDLDGLVVDVAALLETCGLMVDIGDGQYALVAAAARYAPEESTAAADGRTVHPPQLFDIPGVAR